MRKYLLCFICIIFLVSLSFTQETKAAPGDLIWESTLSPVSSARNIAVDYSGIYIAGVINGSQYKIEKRNAGGSVLYESIMNVQSVDITVDSNNVWIVGKNSGVNEWRIEKRSKNDLSLDSSFGSGGVEVAYNGGASSSYAAGVAVDSTGIYISGTECVTNDKCYWRTEKRSLTGSVILWTSGRENPGGTAPGATDIVINNSRAYTIGDYNTGSGYAWRITSRDLNNGTFYNGWNSSRVLADGARAAIDSTGIYLIASVNESSDYSWYIEKINLTNGSSIWIKTSNPKPGVVWAESAYGIIVDDGAGVYITGTDRNTTSSKQQWRIEKRDLNSGDLATDFGVNGVVVNNINTTYNDVPNGIAVSDDGVYVVGMTNWNNASWRIEKREKAIIQRTLSVSKLPSAAGGTVTSNPVGINCGTTCSTASYTYSGGTIILTASPASGYTFSSWIGCDWVIFDECYVNMDSDKTVTAIFTPQYTLTVTKNIAAGGTVTSNPVGINCGTTCSTASYTYNPGTTVTLNYTAVSPYNIASWSGGGCYGTNSCIVTMGADTAVTLDYFATVGLTVVKTGNSTGLVYDLNNPGAIYCGNYCNSSYANGVTYSFQANAYDPLATVSWSGCDSINGNQCTVNFNGARTITADFSYVDCGLRIYDGTQVVSPACEPSGSVTSLLRIWNNGLHGLSLVDSGDSMASKIRIRTSSGVKALKKKPPAPLLNIITDVSNYGFGFSSIAIGADGFPVISTADNGTNGLMVIKCGNAACNSGNITTIVDSLARSNSSIAIGADGFPVISYRHYGILGDRNIRIFKCDNAACNSGVSVIISNSPESSSIAIGADGFPVISYNGSSGLAVLKCGNAACNSGNSTNTVYASNAFVDISIAIGADGFPVISAAYNGTSKLTVLKCGNAACNSGNITTIIDAGNFFSNAAIAIGADGFPVVSAYHDDSFYISNRYLFVIKCGNAACNSGNITTIVDRGGAFNSIAIGTDGFPVVSYGQRDTIVLNVLKCNSSGCFYP